MLKSRIIHVVLAIIAVCLLKLAFFPSSQNKVEIIPNAHASGSIMEWNKALRIVTTGHEGTITYVWDYEGKTKVRKYWLEGGGLKLKVFSMENN